MAEIPASRGRALAPGALSDRHFPLFICSPEAAEHADLSVPGTELSPCPARGPEKGLSIVLPDLLFISLHTVSAQNKVPSGHPNHSATAWDRFEKMGIHPFVVIRGVWGYDNTLIILWFCEILACRKLVKIPSSVGQSPSS